jgi:hypothetical protein
MTVQNRNYRARGFDPHFVGADFVRDVDKSASHHLSQTEIGSDNPCYEQLSEMHPIVRLN